MTGIFDNIKAHKRQHINKIAVELRERLPWLWHPAFSIGAHEGYDGRSFGARAGTLDNINAKNVLHEVAHAVELTLLPSRIWKRRIKRPQYEMKVKSFVEVMGEKYYEPKTMQATERECRVGGIQLRLLEMADYDTKGFVQDFAITLKYMTDYYMGGSCPLNTHDVADYDDEQKQWLNTRMTLIMQAYEDFKPEDIKARWSDVMQWMGKDKAVVATVSTHLDQAWSPN